MSKCARDSGVGGVFCFSVVDPVRPFALGSDDLVESIMACCTRSHPILRDEVVRKPQYRIRESGEGWGCFIDEEQRFLLTFWLESQIL